MKSVKMKLNVKIALVLNEVIQLLMYNDDGSQRTLPFRLQLQLNRNKAILNNIFEDFFSKKDLLISRLADVESEDKAIISDTKSNKYFKSCINEMLDEEINIDVIKLSIDDLDKITNEINISNEALTLLQAYLVDDDAFINDVGIEINYEKISTKHRNSKKVK